MRSDDLRMDPIVDDIDGNAVAVPCHADDLGVDANVDSFAAQNVGDCQGDVFVLARNQARRQFDDRYFAAEAR
jgi:hypothetical protein